MGGGVQSIALCVLVREGILPRPDLVVIADTGREKSTTWRYLHEVAQPYLDPVGVKIEIASHDLAAKDMYSTGGLPLIPAYTKEGRLPTYCSVEWKRRVVNRWLRARGVKECDLWIGFSVDEVGRVSEKDSVKWCRQQFPLIDRMINREMCRGIIRNAGLPIPQKSRCFACPHQNEDEWREVQSDAEDWAKAVALRSGVYLVVGLTSARSPPAGSPPDTS
jgi:hypothetical protein